MVRCSTSAVIGPAPSGFPGGCATPTSRAEAAATTTPDRQATPVGCELANALNITVQRWQEACCSQQAERLVPISSIHEPASSSGDFVPEERWLQRDLQLLKPQQRRLLQRHFIEGDSVRRIAAATGVPQHQLRKSIRAALQLLQRWAEQDGLLPIRSCRPSTALPLALPAASAGH